MSRKGTWGFLQYYTTLIHPFIIHTSILIAMYYVLSIFNSWKMERNSTFIYIFNHFTIYFGIQFIVPLVIYISLLNFLIFFSS